MRPCQLRQLPPQVIDFPCANTVCANCANYPHNPLILLNSRCANSVPYYYVVELRALFGRPRALEGVRP